MATFLQLCASLARESGAISPAPTTVVGQSGRRLQCVNWINEAWTAIQNASPYWSWLRAEFEGTLTIGDNSYTAADLGIATRFNEWVEDTDTRRPMSLYDNTIGRKDEQRLRQVSWDVWKDVYDFGAQQQNRPTVWAIAPDRSLRFGQTPSKAYKVRGEYRKTPQVLAADADVPEMPAHFHDMIWQRAIILMAESDEAPQALQTSMMESSIAMKNLQRDCLPKITFEPGGRIDQ